MNSASKVQAYRAKYHIFMLKAELFALDRYNFVVLKKFYYYCIKPIFGILAIILKFIIVIPFGKLVTLLFPKWAEKTKQEKEETEA